MDDLVGIYGTSDLFVYPTRKDQLGLVLLEAAAMSLPIIATDIGGIKDIVIDGKNGFLMPYSATIYQWGKKITELTNDSQLMLNFRRYSRKLAQEKFKKDIFTKKIIEAFRLCATPIGRDTSKEDR